MAHFALVNSDGIVETVHVINNDVLDAGGDFPASEASGQAFQALLGLKGLWLQCSYNGNFRGNYPGIGFTYDSSRDAFIAPKPYNSWVLDETTCLWRAPIEYPADGGSYEWDESEGDWVEVQVEAL
jgi:hypothetical protein